MKSAITAFVLLIGLTILSGAVSVSQEKILAPICDTFEAFPDKATKITEKNRQELLNTVRKTKKDFEKKSFIIEFGIPHEDSEKVHSLLEKAEIFLESNEDTMFLTLIEELKVSLTNLRDYGKARLDNIT